MLTRSAIALTVAFCFGSIAGVGGQREQLSSAVCSTPCGTKLIDEFNEHVAGHAAAYALNMSLCLSANIELTSPSTFDYKIGLFNFTLKRYDFTRTNSCYVEDRRGYTDRIIQVPTCGDYGFTVIYECTGHSSNIFVVIKKQEMTRECVRDALAYLEVRGLDLPKNAIYHCAGVNTFFEGLINWLPFSNRLAKIFD